MQRNTALIKLSLSARPGYRFTRAIRRSRLTLPYLPDSDYASLRTPMTPRLPISTQLSSPITFSNLDEARVSLDHLVIGSRSLRDELLPLASSIVRRSLPDSGALSLAEQHCITCCFARVIPLPSSEEFSERLTRWILNHILWQRAFTNFMGPETKWNQPIFTAQTR